MDPTLHGIVQARLEEVQGEGDWPYLVMAALEGPDALEALLAGEAKPPAPKPASAAATAPTAKPAPTPVKEAPGAYLRSITVEGFRGIGPRRTLDLAPGPGLTIVAGRNGSGKSSFAEGLEILLTGANWRWEDRSKVWRDGWRNLHHTAKVEVQAELAVEGQPGITRLTRTWPVDGDLAASTDKVHLPDKTSTTVAAIGWADTARTYRPLLSYNELGAMFEGKPTEFHDALARILGLDDLTAAEQALKEARIPRERQARDAKADLDDLLEALAASTDPRARKAHGALKGRKWDLQAAEAVLDGVPSTGNQPTDDLGILRDLAGLTPPSVEKVLEATEQARAAIAAMASAAKTPAGDARRIARILRDALEHHEAHGDGPCPLCGRAGMLDSVWRKVATEEVHRLDEAAAEADQASRLGEQAMHALALVLTSPPTVLDLAKSVRVDAAAAIKAWKKYAAAPTANLEKLADHLERTVGPLDDAVASLRMDAAAELARREDAWRPLARELTAWLVAGRRAQQGQLAAAQLKQAEAWLKSTEGEIRAARFEPIARQARRLWELLRTASSVELERVILDGSGPARRVTLDVTVDGIQGAALSVMSQGELHAMALSLFLPRATVAESPFRFVVIDDPVQSMDPARVDGLARVLEEVARTRQVVVFTHDDRLRESVRRLAIDARVIEVHRREGSVVDLVDGADPVRLNLENADVIAQTGGLPDIVARHTVPGFCRAAIEAACIEVVRRRRIGAGEAHGAVEWVIEANPKVLQRVALAIWDDANRAGDVMKAVGGWGSGLADALALANRGAHTGYGGDLGELIRDTRKLCARIRGLAA